MKTSAPAALIPNPTPALFLVTALAILIWPDATGTTAVVIILGLAVPTALVWFAKSPMAAIAALVIASAVPRLFVEVMGMKAHPEHIVSGAMILVAPFLWKKRERKVQWITADYWVIAYLVLIFFSSIFMSIDPGQTSKWAFEQMLAILFYFWLRLLIVDKERFRWAFRFLLAAGSVACAYAIISFYSNLLFGSTFGVDLEQYGDMPATYGLQYEPNILGAYGAALAVMMLVMYLRERHKKYLIGYAFFGLASMAISLSRAALIATAVTLVLAGFFALRRGWLTQRVILSVAIATMAATIIVLPVVLQHYTERFSTVDVTDFSADPNTLTRAVQTVSAFDEVAKHPIFGGGVASFQLAFDWQSMGIGWEDQGWIGNTELRVLHDTGITGLAAFLVFLFTLIHAARKLLKRELSTEVEALLLSCFVYVITFQATEGTLLAFPWIQLGLIGSAVALSSAEENKEMRPAEIVPA
jgi:hypothetical protein